MKKKKNASTQSNDKTLKSKKTATGEEIFCNLYSLFVSGGKEQPCCIIFIIVQVMRSTRRRAGACVRYIIIMNGSRSAMFTRVHTLTYTVHGVRVFYYRYWFIYLLTFFSSPRSQCAC